MIDWTHIHRRAASLTDGLAWAYLVPGGVLVLLGLLILFVPHLLEVLVATALIVGGVSLLSFGWRLRRAVRWRESTWHQPHDVWPY
jgi:protein-S-isoprenylcysteine O-methyltransferase Ste14